jgi:hypothetical protein
MKLSSLMRPHLAAIFLSCSSLAFAQSPAGVTPAPTGHRQPTASDVPTDDTAKGEGAGASAAGSDSFGPDLRLLPKLDIAATCRRAQPLATGEKSAYQSCYDDEIAAKKELSRKWSSYKASFRSTCAQETRIGGAPSFVEVLTCLELEKQAAEARIENSKPLGTPARAPGARRAPGSRKSPAG